MSDGKLREQEEKGKCWEQGPWVWLAAEVEGDREGSLVWGERGGSVCREAERLWVCESEGMSCGQLKREKEAEGKTWGKGAAACFGRDGSPVLFGKGTERRP